MDNKDILIFDVIKNFVSDLSELYADKQRSLRLYNHLLSKTLNHHNQSINRHIELFTTFCINNRDGIVKKNFDLFTFYKIEYSEKVYINFEHLFKIIDNENVIAIQNHLLYLSALLDKDSDAKNFLPKNKLSKLTSNEVIKDIFSKIENNVDPNKPPMETINNLFQSGLFSDIMNNVSEKLEKGDLDLSSLVNDVQSFVTDSKNELPVKNNPQFNEMLNSLNSVMDNIKEGKEVSDVSSILNPMLKQLNNLSPSSLSVPGGVDGINNILNLVGNMSNNNNNISIEEKINNEYKKLKNESITSKLEKPLESKETKKKSKKSKKDKKT
jgi:hypothetical protein